jgi:hypothetical protein
LVVLFRLISTVGLSGAATALVFLAATARTDIVAPRCFGTLGGRVLDDVAVDVHPAPVASAEQRALAVRDPSAGARTIGRLELDDAVVVAGAAALARDDGQAEPGRVADPPLTASRSASLRVDGSRVSRM